MKEWGAVFILLMCVLVRPGAATGPAYALVGEGLDSVLVAIDINSRLAETRIIYVLSGRGEVVGEFSLPTDAVLTELKASFNGTETAGQIAFGKAGQDRVNEVRVERSKNGNYRISTGVLAGRKAVRIELKYAELLPAVTGRYLYTFDLSADDANASAIPHFSLRAQVDGEMRVVAVKGSDATKALVRTREESTSIDLDLVARAPRSALEIVIGPQGNDADLGAMSWKPSARDLGYFVFWSPPATSSSTYHLRAMGVEDVFGAVGETGWQGVQLGRYNTAGAVRFSGEVGTEVDFSAHEEVAETERENLVSLPLAEYDFESGIRSGWQQSKSSIGTWIMRDGALHIEHTGSGARVYRSISAPAYTIEAMMRFRGREGKVIFHSADQSERWRLDLIASATARLTLGGKQVWGRPPAIVENEWYRVLVQVGNGLVNVIINDQLVHENVPLPIEPDGQIGVGAWAAHSEFDYVRVYAGIAGAATVVRTHPLAQLWAGRQVELLEAQRRLDGAQAELDNHLAHLGYAYHLVNSQTSLVVPTMQMRANKIVASAVDSSAIGDR